jgi:hypothetical protein
MSKSLPGLVGPLDAPSAGPLRHAAATALRLASLMLTRLSQRLREADRHRRAQRPSELEFYAEAGAPEGALYIDGDFVGHLPGVRRL